MGAGIIGLGHYVPEKVLANEDLGQSLGITAESIFQRTGIRERRIAGPEEATSDMAALAAGLALNDAGVEAGEIDLIILATLSPDNCIVPTATAVQTLLKAGKAPSFDLSAGCSGFVYALVMACQVISSGLYRKVLVIGADTMSRVVDWTDAHTAILFGDGAGAVVLAEMPEGYGLLGVELGADGSGYESITMPAGAGRLPATAETVADRLHYLHMDGKSVFTFAMRTLGDSVLRVLKGAGLDPGAVDLFAPHQANIRIIEAAARRINLPMEKVLTNIDRYANTSSASIPIALSEAASGGRIRRDDTMVLVGFGAGLTWASCVMKWF
ncbi:MAG: beta-ketoacyl-ACP synthase III [Syntrophobacteraceae bacterium]